MIISDKGEGRGKKVIHVPCIKLNSGSKRGASRKKSVELGQPEGEKKGTNAAKKKGKKKN